MGAALEPNAPETAMNTAMMAAIDIARQARAIGASRTAGGFCSRMSAGRWRIGGCEGKTVELGGKAKAAWPRHTDEDIPQGRSR
jgi:hypothetical protein